MDLNAVRILVEVVDRGSFTAAAKAVSLPTSSVSRRVAQLERDLGVALLVRTTRKLALTDAGRVYLDRARDAVRALTEAGEEAAEAGSEPRGRVRFTAAADASGLLGAGIAEFARRYPLIEVEAILTSRRVDLVEEGIDLALRAGILEDSTLVSKRIGGTPLHVYAAPSYLAERGAPRRLADLARHDCILYRNVARWTLDGPRGRESVDVRGRISGDDMAFCMNAAIAAGGVVTLPVGLARAPVGEGKLAPVLPRYGLFAGALYLVHPGGRALPRRVALLRDHLFAVMLPVVEREG